MFTPGGGKFSFGGNGGRGSSQQKGNDSAASRGPVPAAFRPTPVNGHSPGSFNAGRGAGIPGNHVSAGRGQAPSRGFVNAGRGSNQSPSGYGNQAGAESFRTYVSAGSEPSFRPANIVKEQGPSSNARGGAGNGRRTSLMPQPQ